jgi:DNA (cytosine-5)-methyltransferase 1
MFRIIQDARPAWVIGENVVDFAKMALDSSLFDLESIGYNVASFIVPACAVDSPQKRERVFFLGHIEGKRREPNFAKHGRFQTPQAKPRGRLAGNGGASTWWDDAARVSWPVESGMVRVVDGVPDRVDRIKGLGNAVVPQLAAEIFRAIKQTGVF